MAILTNPVRLSLRADFAKQLSDRRESFGLSKAQLDAAIAAVDQWVEDNAASFNTALPPAARTGLTAQQKTELLYRVALARFGV